MAAAACGRSAFKIAGFNLCAVTTGAIAMESLSERGDIVYLIQIVTFFAAALIPFDIYKASGFIIRCVMAFSTADIFQIFGMDLMGKRDLRSPQIAEDVLVG